MIKEGVDMLMAGEEWDKARHVAKNIAPKYQQYIEDSYVKYLKDRNRPEEVCVTCHITTADASIDARG